MYCQITFQKSCTDIQPYQFFMKVPISLHSVVLTTVFGTFTYLIDGDGICSLFSYIYLFRGKRKLLVRNYNSNDLPLMKLQSVTHEGTLIN